MRSLEDDLDYRGYSNLPDNSAVPAPTLRHSGRKDWEGHLGSSACTKIEGNIGRKEDSPLTPGYSPGRRSENSPGTFPAQRHHVAFFLTVSR